MKDLYLKQNAHSKMEGLISLRFSACLLLPHMMLATVSFHPNTADWVGRYFVVHKTGTLHSQ